MKISNKKDFKIGETYYIFKEFRKNSLNFSVSGVQPIAEYVLKSINNRTGTLEFLGKKRLHLYYLGDYYIYTDANSAIDQYNSLLEQEIKRIDKAYLRISNYYKQNKYDT